MIEQLIARVFAARNIAHLAHWKTKSYAQHMALGDFYDQIVDDLDAIVECYQGVFGLVGDVPYNQAPSKVSIIQFLEGEAAWIEENVEAISGDNCAVENLIDGLAGTYRTTIYKLKNLT